MPAAVTSTEANAQRADTDRRLAYRLHPVSVMRTRLQRALVLVAILGFASPIVFAPVHAETISCRVVGIADGDTLTILDSSNQQHRVRLSGIDAPEKKQPFGSRAKQNLSALAFGKGATVEWSKLDRYGRIVGKVTVNGEDVGLQQLQAGLAWWYRQYAREQSPQDRASYSQAENEARMARVGLWGDSQSVPPWEYRHNDVRRAAYR